MTIVYKIAECPAESLIFKDLGTADYYDSYMVKSPADDSIDEIKKKIFTLPNWIDMLLKFRHSFIAKPFGLRTGKEAIPEIDRNENEIVLGDDDKHLYFRLSVMKKNAGREFEVYLNTAVKFHNIWGRLYFLPVKPFHKQVVKTLLRKV
jgi:hypothetical protein